MQPLLSTDMLRVPKDLHKADSLVGLGRGPKPLSILSNGVHRSDVEDAPQPLGERKHLSPGTVAPQSSLC